MENIVVVMAVILGTYSLLAAALLGVGAWLKRRRPEKFESRFTATIHILGLLGFLLGLGIVWMAYSSDHPMKHRQTMAPFLLPLLVYGYAVFPELKAWAFRAGASAIRAIIDRIIK